MERSKNVTKTMLKIIKYNMGVNFLSGMMVFYENIGDRGDFRLTTVSGISRDFGYAYEHSLKDI